MGSFGNRQDDELSAVDLPWGAKQSGGALLPNERPPPCPLSLSANKPSGQSLLLYSMPKRFNGCSRLAGSQSLLCEQGVDGLPLRLCEARVEAELGSYYYRCRRVRSGRKRAYLSTALIEVTARARSVNTWCAGIWMTAGQVGDPDP